MAQDLRRHFNTPDRRTFIGGSDARIIMGSDEAALIRLWQEKRGEVGQKDLSDNLIVQLGKATEDLNRTWYERNAGRTVEDVQRLVRHSVTLGGPSHPLRPAADLLEARAQFDGPERAVHIRTAEHSQRIYLELADPCGEGRIDADFAVPSHALTRGGPR